MQLRLISFVVVSLVASLTVAQRPVFPLIPLSGPSPFRPSGRNIEDRVIPGAGQVDTANSEPRPPAPAAPSPSFDDKGIFIETDGQKIGCSSHVDCYDYREPRNWCQLTDGQFWFESGCHCDRSAGACIIQRKSSTQLQWAWCAPKSTWVCPTKKK